MSIDVVPKPTPAPRIKRKRITMVRLILTGEI